MNFTEKIKDIVDLYMSPPEHAIVLACDEKNQTQALDRTQPGLPPQLRHRILGKIHPVPQARYLI